MKVYETALLCLVGVTGCLVYGLSQHASNDETDAQIKTEAQTLHQAIAHKAGSLRRLSLERFQPEPPETAKVVSVAAKPAPIPRKAVSAPKIMPETHVTTSHPVMPSMPVSAARRAPKPQLGLAPRGIPSKLHPPQKRMIEPALPPGIIMPAPETEVKMHLLTLEKADIAAAEPINLSLPQHAETNELFDRVVHMAEASPIQPGSRGCGTTVLDTPKSANNVNSVGYKREITPRIDVGVEYVYKDGCYQNAITPISSQDMPADDGVNIRLNMRF